MATLPTGGLQMAGSSQDRLGDHNDGFSIGLDLSSSLRSGAEPSEILKFYYVVVLSRTAPGPSTRAPRPPFAIVRPIIVPYSITATADGAGGVSSVQASSGRATPTLNMQLVPSYDNILMRANADSSNGLSRYNHALCSVATRTFV